MDKVNLNFYGLNFNKPVAKEEDKKPVLEEEQEVKPEQKQVADKDMLDAMVLSGAQNKAFVSGVANLPDVQKYVDAESAQRIAGYVAGFEKMYDTGMAELKGNPAAEKIVLSTIETMM